MKSTERDNLLIDVLRAMRYQTDSAKRYDLQSIGESLITEYRDLSVSYTEKKILEATEQ